MTKVVFTTAQMRKIQRRREAMNARAVNQFRKKLNESHPRRCNVCGYEGLFATIVHLAVRFDGKCPNCRSRERLRLNMLWFEDNMDVLKGMDVLHFAPEGQFRKFLSENANSYKTADLFREDVDLNLDITNIELPDKSFGLVIAHQVLEHVDHNLALREIYRILIPGGCFIATTPVVNNWKHTYYNDKVSSNSERLLHFGQADHTHWFGVDVKDHMREAGFDVEEFVPEGEIVVELALWRGESLFVLHKPLEY